MEALVDERPAAAPTQPAPAVAITTRALAWVRANPLLVAFIVGGLIARIVFWAWTERVLDDAYITVKHSKNFVDGLGLTHHLGEDGPVHGFTSALSVLVPIPGELFAEAGGILVLRLASLAAFVAAAVYADRIGRHLECGPWARGLVLAYLAFDHIQIFYGMAGMETQIATAVLLAGVYYVLAEDRIRAGVLLGLAPLARPDFIVWVGLAYLFLFWRDRRQAVRSAVVSGAVLAPWLIFTTIYYGSPIPNTIKAKSMAAPVEFPALTDIGGWGDYLSDLINRAGDWVLSIAPFIDRGAVVGTPFPELPLEIVAWGLFGLAVVGSIANWKHVLLRPAILFIAFWIAYRLTFLKDGYFEWYGVPTFALLAVLAGAGVQALASRARPLAAVVAVVIGVAYAVPLAWTFPVEERVQHDIEDPVRTGIGRYLEEVIAPGETFTAEPSGYFGFYTNGQLLDYPGLTSTTVTGGLTEYDQRQEQAVAVAYFLPRFDPDWAILRPEEWRYVQTSFPKTAAKYEIVREFESTREPILMQGGYGVYNIDTHFLVLRRSDSS